MAAGQLEGRELHDVSALVRLPHCKKQMWHRDFPVWEHEHPHLVVKPRTAWVVLEAGNEIEIGLEPPLSFVLSRDRLAVGDIVLFDGNVSHRGVPGSSR